MKEKLYQAIGNIDDKYLQEYNTSKHKQKRFNFIPILALTVSFSLLFMFILPNKNTKHHLHVFAKMNNERINLVSGVGMQSSQLLILDKANKTPEELAMMENNLDYYLSIHDLFNNLEDGTFRQFVPGNKAYVISQFSTGISLEIDQLEDLQQIKISHDQNEIGELEYILDSDLSTDYMTCSEEENNIILMDGKHYKEAIDHQQDYHANELRWIIHPNYLKEIANIGSSFDLTTIQDTIHITAIYSNHEETIHLQVCFIKDGSCIIGVGENMEIHYQTIEYQPKDELIGLLYYKASDHRFNTQQSYTLDQLKALPDTIHYDLSPINMHTDPNMIFEQYQKEDHLKYVYQLSVDQSEISNDDSVYSFHPIFQKKNGEIELGESINLGIASIFETYYQTDLSNIRLKVYITAK